MVDEQKTTEETPTARPVGDTQTGNIETTASALERADALRKSLEETETRIKEHVDKFENILARQMLSGRSQAGEAQKTNTEIQAEQVEKEAAEIINRFKR